MSSSGVLILCFFLSVTVVVICLFVCDSGAMLILCVCVRWQPLDRTLGNAYTHNDRSSSRLSGLSSLVLLSFNCYLHGSKREAIYIHNCNFRGPNTSGGNHQSLLTEDSEHTRTGLRPDKMMIFHLVDRRILSVYI